MPKLHTPGVYRLGLQPVKPATRIFLPPSASAAVCSGAGSMDCTLWSDAPQNEPQAVEDDALQVGGVMAEPPGSENHWHTASSATRRPSPGLAS